MAYRCLVDDEAGDFLARKAWTLAQRVRWPGNDCHLNRRRLPTQEHN